MHHKRQSRTDSFPAEGRSNLGRGERYQVGLQRLVNGKLIKPGNGDPPNPQNDPSRLLSPQNLMTTS
jgi:hypothetical protein